MKRIIISLLLGCILASSCKTAERMATDTIYRDVKYTEYRYLHDSVFVDRWHDRWVKGDTVFLRDSVYSYRYIYMHDTISSTDTLYKTRVEVKKEVEVRNRYPLLPYSILALVAAGLYLGRQIYKKRKEFYP